MLPPCFLMNPGGQSILTCDSAPNTEFGYDAIGGLGFLDWDGFFPVGATAPGSIQRILSFSTQFQVWLEDNSIPLLTQSFFKSIEFIDHSGMGRLFATASATSFSRISIPGGHAAAWSWTIGAPIWAAGDVSPIIVR